MTETADILPELPQIPGLEDGIEEDLAQIRADIDKAARMARRDAPLPQSRCHCPRCLVIG